MPTVLPLDIEPVLATGRYRHMAKRDAPVWERFVQKFGAAFVGVAYDVALGGTKAPGAGLPDGDVLGYQYSTALKLDALLFAVDHVLVVEVRPWATVSAFGAALAYSLVLNRENVTRLPIQPALVCEGIQADVRWVCDQSGVLVYVV